MYKGCTVYLCGNFRLIGFGKIIHTLDGGITILTSRACFTFFTLGTLGALGAGVAFFTLGALGAGVAFFALGALGAGVAFFALGALGAGITFELTASLCLGQGIVDSFGQLVSVQLVLG